MGEVGGDNSGRLPHNRPSFQHHHAAGYQAGPYEIINAIGQGGMGEVYRARDARLQRLVAIKTLASHASADPQFHERFEREARAVAALAPQQHSPSMTSGATRGSRMSRWSCSRAKRSAHASAPRRSCSTAVEYAVQIGAAWPPPTIAASSIAISSRRTSSSPVTAR